MTPFEKLSLVLATFSALLAAGAVLISLFTFRRQVELTKSLHEQQILLSQRQIFISLWPTLSNLRKLDPQKPIHPDVVNAVNTLQLLAVCCEGGAVDALLVRRAFADSFLEMCDMIESVPKMASLGKSGLELLRENPPVERLREELLIERRGRGALKPIK